MLRHNDFTPILRTLPGDRLKRIDESVRRLIEENPGQRANLSAGPAYFLMHYLMSDLYTAIALYRTETPGGQKNSLLKWTGVLLRLAGKQIK